MKNNEAGKDEQMMRIICSSFYIPRDEVDLLCEVLHFDPSIKT
ncbi:hypothetical protein [Oceanobacillus senegalensis]|nr:hypothetical protein [Oceanobacillus senegalensis]